MLQRRVRFSCSTRAAERRSSARSPAASAASKAFMGRRVSQGKAGRRGGGVPTWALALAVFAAPAAHAQYHNPSEPGDYRQQPHPGEDAVAIAFLEGRYTSPVTCKRADGSSVEIPVSIVFKEAPEAGGGDIGKMTFFGVDIADAAYCYSLI